MSSGLADGYLGLHNGASYDIDWIRLTGKIKPANRIFENIWLNGSISYNLYEGEDVIHEILGLHLVLGAGFRMAESGFFGDMVPYIGAGAGFTGLFSRYQINSGSPVMEDNQGLSYIQQGGLEYRLTDTLVVFIEEKYIWGSIKRRKNYIPDYYGDDSKGSDSSFDEEYTFDRNQIKLRQFTLKAGVRFYWGQNMFWFFPFFWEK
ncbi:MAG: hypothetical protein PHF84_00465 [bacterium]|nr:hypothetical protein [bacterium]